MRARRASAVPNTLDQSSSSFISYRSGELCMEGVALSAVAREFGTPCYVYSRAALTSAFAGFDAAFGPHPHLICYSVKANPNLAVLDLFARLGSGFDIVSGGELARVLAAGADPGKVVFSGVGKSAEEIGQALDADILSFNIESPAELHRVCQLAEAAGKKARVSLRVNPDVDPQTHPYISTGRKQDKFGVAFEDAFELYREASHLPGLAISGVDCHIGSEITEVRPFLDALDRLLTLVDRLAAGGIAIHHLDLGGGFGIRYRDEQPPSPGAFVRALLERLRGYPQRILLEPGRALVGNAGVLLTRVEYLKPGDERNFAVVDAGMNDLIRPALYEAWHDIRPLRPRAEPPRRYEVVGPVCESADFLGHERDLALQPGDLLAVMSAGAYGMSMSSNYNTRPRPAEVMVDGGRPHLIRTRETAAQLFSLERPLG
ncbi:MAG TPA: diaminopimelate decarboxylase [Burkholderiales bacterium]|nr:diaminopimelate decarboxylase [Burkholderiales bacterium]